MEKILNPKLPVMHTKSNLKNDISKPYVYSLCGNTCLFVGGILFTTPITPMAIIAVVLIFCRYAIRILIWSRFMQKKRKKTCFYIMHKIQVLCSQIFVTFEKTGVIDMKMNWFVAKCSANTQTAR